MAQGSTHHTRNPHQFWFRATWGSCVTVLFAPAIIPMPNANARWFAVAGVLLFVFGIIQAIRNELYKAERLKALARGKCPSCGFDIGIDSGDKDPQTCPRCGETVGDQSHNAG
jgi:ribosomal protein S27AE